MIHEILPVGMLQCNCSIFGNEATREAIVMDPGAEVDEIEKVLRRHNLKVTAIVITHAHIDHVGGAAELRRRTGAPVWMNAEDRLLYDHLDMQAAWLAMETPERAPIDVDAREGGKLTLGQAEFHVLHTPGHSRGSISLWCPQQNKVVAGDTLFFDSIGRTDLPGGDAKQILRSIKEKLLVLPEDAIVVTGHGDLTTIGREKERNPFLQHF